MNADLKALQLEFDKDKVALQEKIIKQQEEYQKMKEERAQAERDLAKQSMQWQEQLLQVMQANAANAKLASEQQAALLATITEIQNRPMPNPTLCTIC
ncbi:unnamed protein product [Rotaria sp. Silwood1]|nr:unnamed protein product [Rotaria sp. Silwood1]